MNPRRLSKVTVAIGGCLIFVGVMIVGVLAFVLTPAFDTSTLERVLVDYRILFWAVLLALGLLHVVSGIILRHR